MSECLSIQCRATLEWIKRPSRRLNVTECLAWHRPRSIGLNFESSDEIRCSLAISPGIACVNTIYTNTMYTDTIYTSFACSQFFTAAICTYIYIHIIQFHLYRTVNIYWNWLQEQFCNLSLYTLFILSVQYISLKMISLKNSLLKKRNGLSLGYWLGRV